MALSARFTVGWQQQGMPLLRFLRQRLPTASRKALKRAIARGYCAINAHKEIFASHPLQQGEQVQLALRGLEDQPAAAAKIVFEDRHLLACNKPPLQLSAPALLPGVALYQRLVHRLDKETSGLLLFAKNAAAYAQLRQQFAQRAVVKVYLAIVSGRRLPQQGRRESRLAVRQRYCGQTIYGSRRAGKYAVTRWQVLATSTTAPITLVACYPQTGRTHQIRVHLAELGHPVVGDPLYGKRCDVAPAPRLLLHAYRLFLNHPQQPRRLALQGALAADFLTALADLGLPLEKLIGNGPRGDDGIAEDLFERSQLR